MENPSGNEHPVCKFCIDIQFAAHLRQIQKFLAASFCSGEGSHAFPVGFESAAGNHIFPSSAARGGAPASAAEGASTLSTRGEQQQQQLLTLPFAALLCGLRFPYPQVTAATEATASATRAARTPTDPGGAAAEAAGVLRELARVATGPACEAAEPAKAETEATKAATEAAKAAAGEVTNRSAAGSRPATGERTADNSSRLLVCACIRMIRVEEHFFRLLSSSSNSKGNNSSSSSYSVRRDEFKAAESAFKSLDDAVREDLHACALLLPAGAEVLGVCTCCSLSQAEAVARGALQQHQKQEPPKKEQQRQLLHPRHVEEEEEQQQQPKSAEISANQAKEQKHTQGLQQKQQPQEKVHRLAYYEQHPPQQQFLLYVAAAVRKGLRSTCPYGGDTHQEQQPWCCCTASSTGTSFLLATPWLSTLDRTPATSTAVPVSEGATKLATAATRGGAAGWATTGEPAPVATAAAAAAATGTVTPAVVGLLTTADARASHTAELNVRASKAHTDLLWDWWEVSGEAAKYDTNFHATSAPHVAPADARPHAAAGASETGSTGIATAPTTSTATTEAGLLTSAAAAAVGAAIRPVTPAAVKMATATAGAAETAAATTAQAPAAVSASARSHETSPTPLPAAPAAGTAISEADTGEGRTIAPDKRALPATIKIVDGALMLREASLLLLRSTVQLSLPLSVPHAVKVHWAAPATTKRSVVQATKLETETTNEFKDTGERTCNGKWQLADNFMNTAILLEILRVLRQREALLSDPNSLYFCMPGGVYVHPGASWMPLRGGSVRQKEQELALNQNEEEQQYIHVHTLLEKQRLQHEQQQHTLEAALTRAYKAGCRRNDHSSEVLFFERTRQRQRNTSEAEVDTGLKTIGAVSPYERKKQLLLQVPWLAPTCMYENIKAFTHAVEMRLSALPIPAFLSCAALPLRPQKQEELQGIPHPHPQQQEELEENPYKVPLEGNSETMWQQDQEQLKQEDTDRQQEKREYSQQHDSDAECQAPPTMCTCIDLNAVDVTETVAAGSAASSPVVSPIDKHRKSVLTHGDTTATAVALLTRLSIELDVCVVVCKDYQIGFCASLLQLAFCRQIRLLAVGLTAAYAPAAASHSSCLSAHAAAEAATTGGNATIHANNASCCLFSLRPVWGHAGAVREALRGGAGGAGGGEKRERAAGEKGNGHDAAHEENFMWHQVAAQGTGAATEASASSSSFSSSSSRPDAKARASRGGGQNNRAAAGEPEDMVHRKIAERVGGGSEAAAAAEEKRMRHRATTPIPVRDVFTAELLLKVSLIRTPWMPLLLLSCCGNTDSATRRQQLLQQTAAVDIQPTFRCSLPWNEASQWGNKLFFPHAATLGDRLLEETYGSYALARGAFVYFHYLQDGEDDAGWGCCYRALQTLFSWYKLQNYTAHVSFNNKAGIEVNDCQPYCPLVCALRAMLPVHLELQEVPSIAAIQRLLRRFDPAHEDLQVGSKTWIGTVEATYVVAWLLDMACKIKFFPHVAAFLSHSDDLRAHFDTAGTPVLVGIGQYAYVIVGLRTQKETGESEYLVVDPHYRGADINPEKITVNGWIGWKKPTFFEKRANSKFVNVALPQLYSEKGTSFL